MRHADVVRVSYSGTRHQTFIFEERGPAIDQNLKAAQVFIQRCSEVTSAVKEAKAKRWQFNDVPREVITEFLDAYAFHPDQVSLRADHMVGWIERVAAEASWNVVVAGSSKPAKDASGRIVDLGTVDLGLDEEVPTVNRAPLKSPGVGTANIKALLSHPDWFRDLAEEVLDSLSAEEKKIPQTVRRDHADGRGLLLVYPVSKDSVPMGKAAKVGTTRRNMEAESHLIGLGIIFPDVDRDGIATEATYYSVHPDWEPVVEDDDEIPVDNEASAQVDGETAGTGEV